MKSGDERRSGVDGRVADRRKHERIGSTDPDPRKAERRAGYEPRQNDKI